jgi:tetratricopeptide (TPR) repeat protein
MIDPERYQRAKEAFLELCDTADPEAVLGQVCGDDAALMQLVRDMLREDRGGASTIDRAALPGAGAALMIGRRIGRYVVRSIVGEGGMGIVYQAEQENPRRTVALKLLRPPFATPGALRRFHHEAQALGRLQHPGIAQIVEAGQADGTPYFAMEFIRGVPVLQYAADHELDTEARLELVARIADAVHHAHQKGVVHRDLKPANILVDETGQPKVLDFGIARLLDDAATAPTLQTTTGQLIGTVASMSPEQAAGDPSAIDTRTDVYALGLILYELLAGRGPYVVAGATLQESLRIIREAEPVRLGTIDRRHRGDIETAVAHALEKDRERRYPSAAELAADLRRILAHEPIQARPATTAYQLRKFARRNRALVAGAVSALAALLLGLLGVTLALGRALEAREAEAGQRRIAEAVNLFLNDDLLAAVSPYEMGKDVTMRAVLDDAAAHIAGRFDQDPLVEAEIRSTLGKAYWQLGELELAEPHLVRALELRREHLKTPSDPLAESLTRLAHLYRNRGEFARAEPLYREALEIRTAGLGESAPLRINSLTNLAGLYREHGEWVRALPLCERACALARESLPADAPARISAEELLAGALKDLGRAREAVPLMEEVLRLRRAGGPPDHPEVLRTMNSLAVCYRAAGQHDRAIALFEEALAARRRVLGHDHPDLLPSLTNLASAYAEARRFDEAEPLYRQAIAAARQVFGPDHRGTLIPMVGLGRLLRLTERLSEAESLLVEALAGFQRIQGPEAPRTLDAANELAALYLAQARFREADPVSSAALASARTTLPPDHPTLLSLLRSRAACLRGLGRSDDAAPLQEEADRIAAARQAPNAGGASN